MYESSILVVGDGVLAKNDGSNRSIEKVDLQEKTKIIHITYKIAKTANKDRNRITS